jgi:hypothetical protein
MRTVDDPAIRYIQERLPNFGIQILAAHPCPSCRGTLILRRRRFVCNGCDHSEAAPPAIAARLAGQPELALFENEEDL